jgi:hypothetical protein
MAAAGTVDPPRPNNAHVPLKPFLPWWWYACLTALVLAGGLLLWLNLLLPPELRVVSGHSLPRAWSRFVGAALLGVVVHHLVVFWSARIVGRLLRIDADFTPTDMLSPALLGLCEAVFYPGAFFLHKPEFIGVWLAIKVAGQWVRWGGAPDAASTMEALHKGRRLFNRFLIGNAVSVIAGIALWVALAALLTLDRGA